MNINLMPNKSDFKLVGDEVVTDITLLGFIANPQELKCSVYCLLKTLEDEGNDMIIMMCTFDMDPKRVDQQMQYLNNPVHDIINLTKLGDTGSPQFRAIHNIMEKCGGGNSYFTDYMVEGYPLKKDVMIDGYREYLNGRKERKRFHLSTNVYIMIRESISYLTIETPLVIKSKALRKLYDNIIVKNVEDLNYVGFYDIDKVNDRILMVYRTESDVFTQPVFGISHQIMNERYKLDDEEFYKAISGVNDIRNIEMKNVITFEIFPGYKTFGLLYKYYTGSTLYYVDRNIKDYMCIFNPIRYIYK